MSKTKSLAVGLIGIPNVGKSLVFNILTKSKVPSANYPFCTVEPHHGKMAVYDRNLEFIKKYYTGLPVPSEVNLIDIAGLIKGAASGAGLGNRFLSTVREADALIQLVRCFRDEDVLLDSGNTTNNQLSARSPVDDIEVIQTELCLADLETIEKAMAKKTITKQTFEFLSNRLNSNFSPIAIEEVAQRPEQEQLEIAQLRLLTTKPVLYLCNLDDAQATALVANLPYFEHHEAFNAEMNELPEELKSNHDLGHIIKVHEWCKRTNSKIAFIAAGVEAGVADFETFADEQNYRNELTELGISIPDRNILSAKILQLLNLGSFYTAGEIEIRAWLIPKDASARTAASKIHTDIAKSLIKAQSFSINDLIEYKSEANVKSAGRLKSDGPDKPMRANHIYNFMHNAK